MMRKLHLDLDRLKVDTFETSSAPRGRQGTVRGHGEALPTVIDTSGWYLTQGCPSQSICPSTICPPNDPNSSFRISDVCHEWTVGATEQA